MAYRASIIIFNPYFLQIIVIDALLERFIFKWLSISSFVSELQGKAYEIHTREKKTKQRFYDFVPAAICLRFLLFRFSLFLSKYMLWSWNILLYRYIGHLKERSLKDQMAKDPTEVIRKAVLRMLPRNKLRIVSSTSLPYYKYEWSQFETLLDLNLRWL